MRSPLIAQRCRSRTDIYPRSSDDTWRFEGCKTSNVSDYSAWSPNTPFIKANVLIDGDGHARLADFGLLTIVPDSTNSTTTSSSNSAGTMRWMSPELFDPERFGLKDKRQTKESDCYALAMVILEVLTSQVPFPRHDGFIVMRKVVDGERPERPQGQEAAWFTDNLWRMLEQCWSSDPKLRPAVEAVLECLGSMAWCPLPPSADDDFQLDDDHDSFSTMSHLSRTSLHLYLDLHLPTKLSSANPTALQDDDQSAVLSQSPPHDANIGRGSSRQSSVSRQQPTDRQDKLLLPENERGAVVDIQHLLEST